MALLTADDVLNKKFQSVKFREGYDQIEVDEFLDEVVATIYALTVENTELKEQLEAANRRVEELSSGEAAAAPVYVAPEPEPEPEPVAEVVEEVQVDEQPDASVESPQAATSMLALAQRLHDEYVEDGREEAKRIISEAREEASTIISEANSKRDNILMQLGDEQRELENSINSLREFEADYRGAISDHLTTLLDQVKNSQVPDQN